MVAIANVTEQHRAQATALRDAGNGVVIFGDFAARHPAASTLRALARSIARATGCAFNEVASGPNAVGLTRVGVLPLRDGLNVGGMLAAPCRALIAYNVYELDFHDAGAFAKARAAADFCIAIGAYADEGVLADAHVVLPIGLLPEIDGTFVNVDGLMQRTAPAVKVKGEVRDGWRVLRALGAALGVDGFGFTELAELRAQLDPLLHGGPSPARNPGPAPEHARAAADSLTRIATVGIYRVDAVVRRSDALQRTPLSRAPMLSINPADALARGLGLGAYATVSDGVHQVVLPVEANTAVPMGGAWIEAGHKETAGLAGTGAALTVARASL